MKSLKCNICKHPSADLIAHYAEAHRVGNARAIMVIRAARAAGAKQYGSRFEGWLKANGVTDTAAAIAKIEGR